jgi:hypothetical protein
MPPIPASLLPRGSAGASTRRLSQTSERPAASDGTGAFRTVCEFSHMNYDDPIVFPGKPGASHLHAFFGNTGTNANSSATTISHTGSSTCRGGTINRTAYWVPALFDARGQPVEPEYLDVYYKSGYNGVAAKDIQPFPEGLRMVAGDPHASAAQSRAYWGCRDHYIGHVGNIPDCPSGDRLAMVIEFPQCWDGKNLDSSDHRSHMAYPARGGCPSTHPIPIPAITLNVYYAVSNGRAGAFRLASDMYDASLPGGFSVHGDWFDGWEPEIAKTFVQRCINPALDCHSHLLGDGRAME